MKAGRMATKWPPRSRARCCGCGEFFGGVQGFDKHQTGIDPVICNPPGERGLEQDQDGVWRFPKSHTAGLK